LQRGEQIIARLFFYRAREWRNTRENGGINVAGLKKENATGSAV
jgi:hypothetical protein